MDTKKREFDMDKWAKKQMDIPVMSEYAKTIKKAKTLPEVVADMGKIAAEWGGVTESIRQLDKDGRIREISVTIKFTAV